MANSIKALCQFNQNFRSQKIEKKINEKMAQNLPN